MTHRLSVLAPALLGLALLALPAASAAENDPPDVASLQSTFETAVAALNSGDLNGFLDTVHEEALSFYACGPTSGKQGREACAIDWNLFFNNATGAEFRTSNEQYRVIGGTGIAYGEYALSVLYDGKQRMTVHEGRYTMTYIQSGDRWQVIMQHNTPAGDDPQPVKNLRPGLIRPPPDPHAGNLQNLRLLPDTQPLTPETSLFR